MVDIKVYDENVNQIESESNIQQSAIQLIQNKKCLDSEYIIHIKKCLYCNFNQQKQEQPSAGQSKINPSVKLEIIKQCNNKLEKEYGQHNIPEINKLNKEQKLNQQDNHVDNEGKIEFDHDDLVKHPSTGDRIIPHQAIMIKNATLPIKIIGLYINNCYYHDMIEDLNGALTLDIILPGQQRKKIKLKSLINLQHIKVNRSLINYYQFKQFLKEFKESLLTIQLKNSCILHNRSSLKKFEVYYERAYTLRVTFLQDYIQPIFFPKLTILSINLRGPYGRLEFAAKKRRQEKEQYNEVLEELATKLETHKKFYRLLKPWNSKYETKVIIDNPENLAKVSSTSESSFSATQQQQMLSFTITKEFFSDMHIKHYQISLFVNFQDRIREVILCNVPTFLVVQWQGFIEFVRELKLVRVLKLINIALRAVHLRDLRPLFWLRTDWLEELWLVNNGLTDHNISYLLEDRFLVTNQRNLRLFNLSQNFISAKQIDFIDKLFNNMQNNGTKRVQVICNNPGMTSSLEKRMLNVNLQGSVNIVNENSLNKIISYFNKNKNLQVIKFSIQPSQPLQLPNTHVLIAKLLFENKFITKAKYNCTYFSQKQLFAIQKYLRTSPYRINTNPSINVKSLHLQKLNYECSQPELLLTLMQDIFIYYSLSLEKISFRKSNLEKKYALSIYNAMRQIRFVQLHTLNFSNAYGFEEQDTDSFSKLLDCFIQKMDCPLKKLNLQNLQTASSEHFAHVSQVLNKTDQKNIALEWLNISQNANIRAETFSDMVIKLGLSQSQTLQYLDISQINFSQDHLVGLTSALKSPQSFQVLSFLKLARNNIGKIKDQENSFTQFVTALAQRGQQFEELDLSENNLSSEQIQSLTQVLMTSAPFKKLIKFQIFGKNQASELIIQNFILAIATCCGASLQELNLREFSLNSTIIDFICNLYSNTQNTVDCQFKAIKKLDLSSNPKLSSQAIKKLLQTFKENKINTLDEIILDNMNINEFQSNQIDNMLDGCSWFNNLKIFKFNNKQLSAQQLYFFICSLKRETSRNIQIIDLMGVELTINHIEFIIQALLLAELKEYHFQNLQKLKLNYKEFKKLLHPKQSHQQQNPQQQVQSSMQPQTLIGKFFAALQSNAFENYIEVNLEEMNLTNEEAQDLALVFCQDNQSHFKQIKKIKLTGNGNLNQSAFSSLFEALISLSNQSLVKLEMNNMNFSDSLVDRIEEILAKFHLSKLDIIELKNNGQMTSNALSKLVIQLAQATDIQNTDKISFQGEVKRKNNEFIKPASIKAISNVFLVNNQESSASQEDNRGLTKIKKQISSLKNQQDQPKLESFIFQSEMPADQTGELFRSINYTWCDTLKMIEIKRCSKMQMFHITQILQYITFDVLEVMDFSYNDCISDVDIFSDFIKSLTCAKATLKELNIKKIKLKEYQIEQMINFINAEGIAKKESQLYISIDMPSNVSQKVQDLAKSFLIPLPKPSLYEKYSQNKQEIYLDDYNSQLSYIQIMNIIKQKLMERQQEGQNYNSDTQQMLSTFNTFKNNRNQDKEIQQQSRGFKIILKAKLEKLSTQNPQSIFMLFSFKQIAWQNSEELVDFTNKLSRDQATLYFGHIYLAFLQRMQLRPNNIKSIHTYILQKSFFKVSQDFVFNKIVFMNSKVFPLFSKFYDKNNQFIFKVYKWASISKIQHIYLEYEFTNFDHIQHWKEPDIIKFFNMLPPTTIDFNNTNRIFSLGFYKTFFTILSQHPYLETISVNIDQAYITNTCLAYYLKNKVCYNYSSKIISSITSSASGGTIVTGQTEIKESFPNFIQSFFRKGFYTLFNAIQGDKIDYKIDQQSFMLDHDMNSQSSRDFQFFKSVILLLIPLFYFISIFSPLYFTQQDNLMNFQSCSRGLSWKSYYIFVGFMLLTLFIEGYLYTDILNRVGHLLPGLRISLGSGFLIDLANNVKRFIINFRFDYKYMLFLTSFIMSQIARFDFFSDVSFVIKCFYQCPGNYDIGLFSLVILSLVIFDTVWRYSKAIYHVFYHASHPLPMNSINQYYELSVLLEMHALGDILDIVSCYNVEFLPIVLQPVSQRIYNIFIKTLGEDVPQIILQIIYLLRSNQSSFADNQQTYLSIFSNIIMLILSIYKLFSMQPSTIFQVDFNNLINKKKQNLNQYIKNQIAFEEKQFNMGLTKKHQKSLIKWLSNLQYDYNVQLSKFNPDKHISQLLNEIDKTISWHLDKQITYSLVDKTSRKKVQLIQNKYLNLNIQELSDHLWLKHKLLKYHKECENNLINIEKYQDFILNGLNYEYQAIDWLYDNRLKKADVTLQRQKNQILVIMIYDDLSRDLTKEFIEYHNWFSRVNVQQNKLNVKFITILFHEDQEYLNNIINDDNQILNATSVDFYSLEDYKESYINQLYQQEKYPFYLIVDEQNQIKMVNLEQDSLCECLKKLLSTKQQQNLAPQKTVNIPPNIYKAIKFYIYPKPSDQKWQNLEIEANLLELEEIAAKSKICLKFNLVLQKVKPYFNNHFIKDKKTKGDTKKYYKLILNLLIETGTYNLIKNINLLNINGIGNESAADTISLPTENAANIQPNSQQKFTIQELESLIIKSLNKIPQTLYEVKEQNSTMNLQLGSTCSICKYTPLYKGKYNYQYWSKQTNEYLCPSCAEPNLDLSKNQLDYPFKLVYMPNEGSEEFLNGVEVYKFGFEEQYWSEYIKYPQTKKDIICSGCQNIVRGYRYICLNCKKGQLLNQEDNFIEFCDDCFTTMIDPQKVEQQMNILENCKDSQHVLNHVLLRVIHHIDSYYFKY